MTYGCGDTSYVYPHISELVAGHALIMFASQGMH